MSGAEHADEDEADDKEMVARAAFQEALNDEWLTHVQRRVDAPADAFGQMSNVPHTGHAELDMQPARDALQRVREQLVQRPEPHGDLLVQLDSARSVVAYVGPGERLDPLKLRLAVDAIVAVERGATVLPNAGRLLPDLRAARWRVLDGLIALTAATALPGAGARPAAASASESSGDLAQTAGGHLSHEEIAGRVRMLMRTDLDHEAVCVMGRDRIRWLARRVSELERQLEGERPRGSLPPHDDLRAALKTTEPLFIDYTNYRGERSVRVIRPVSEPYFGTTAHHPEAQWMVNAVDVERDLERSFALRDVHAWGPARDRLTPAP